MDRRFAGMDTGFPLPARVHERSRIRAAEAFRRKCAQRVAEGELADPSHRFGVTEREEPSQRDPAEQPREHARPVHRKPRQDARAEQVLARHVIRQHARET
jgi:hypothetical protein